MLFLYAKKGELSVIEHKLSCREYETLIFIRDFVAVAHVSSHALSRAAFCYF